MKTARHLYPQLMDRLFRKPLVITVSRHRELVRILESRLVSESPEPTVTIQTEDDNDEDDFQKVGPDMVIPVHGVIVPHAEDIPMSTCGCGLDMVSAMIDEGLADPEVEKLVFDFRTPGGSITGVPEIARKIGAITSKMTVGFTDDECCSAGVWMATQCQHFYCTQSASVGSIGVWSAYSDLSRALAMEGENIQAISAGKYKLLGAYWKPLSSEEVAMLQQDIDKWYEEFKGAVNSRREIADKYMQGQIFSGDEAVEIGLCDGLVEGLDELLYTVEKESE